MPVPTITPPTQPRVIALGVPFSLQLSASESPTAWATPVALPTGLSINSSGLISGTPTTAAYYSSTVTATNGSGTSEAVPLGILVLTAPAGLAGNTLAFPLDWDLTTGKLSVPGISGPEPAHYPPAASGAAATPLLVWKVPQSFVASIGISNGGVLQEPAGLTHLYATVKRLEDEPGVSLAADPTDITVTGADETARHELKFELLTDSLLPGWLADEELADGTQTYVDALLELALSVADDERDFSASDSDAIASFARNQTKDKTFSVALSEQAADQDYLVTASFVCTTDPALSAELAVVIGTSWGGSAFDVTVSLPSPVVTSPTNPQDWNVTFSIQSITGDAAGFDVAVRAVSQNTTATYMKLLVDDPGITVTSAALELLSTLNLEILASSSVIAAFDLEDGDTISDIISAVTAALSPTAAAGALITAEFVGNAVQFYFTSASGIDEIVVDSASSYTSPGSTIIPGPTYTNTFFALAITGREHPEREVSRVSQSAPVRLVRALRPAT